MLYRILRIQIQIRIKFEKVDNDGVQLGPDKNIAFIVSAITQKVLIKTENFIQKGNVK